MGLAIATDPEDGSPPAPGSGIAEPSEVSALAAPQRGWPPAFVDLYRSRYLPMVRLAFLLLGSNAVAEEVVQEAFVRVHNAVGHVDNPAAYLRVAVVNGCRNEQRHADVERRHRPAIVPPAFVDQPDHLADALSKLPDRQRAVLVLRYYEGMTEAEIAVALGCRRGTVKSATSRALEQLRRVIEP